MAEEHEDVIFENSPLFQHLTEVGFTDFHAETLTDEKERPRLIINEHLKQNYDGNLANRNLKEWAINSAKRFISGYFLPSTVAEISWHSFCVAMIKSSGLLADDDLELIYRYEQCTDTTYDVNTASPVEFENNNKLTEANNFVFFNLVTNKCMVGIMLLIAIILGLLLKYIDSNELKILSCFSLLIVSIWPLSRLYFLHIKNKIDILKKNVALLVDYIKFTEKLLVLKRKIILFIQEKELIARGHIIVNPAAPVRGIEGQIKQCVMLRKCLSIQMNNYLGLLYNQIKNVLDSRFCCTQYHGNIDWLQKELCRIEKQCLTESERNLQPNEYSLTTLKKTYATLGSRQSSLLCCLAVNLMLLITYLKQSQKKQDTFNQFHCLEYLLGEGKKCFDNLNECYKFHKVEIPAHIFDENQVLVPSNNTVFQPFTLALHSMTLHLQQACKTSIEIEGKLDKMTKESTELPACLDFDEMNNQMLFIGREIDKLSVCYEESKSRLEEIAIQSSKKQSVENVVEENTNENSLEQEEKDVQILNLGVAEPVPDQIFEGETTADHDVGIQYSTSSLGREELWREEKLREEGRHLLKELKFVLATKDEQKMVAIPKVLLKKFSAVDVGSTTETSCVGEEEPMKPHESDVTDKEAAVSMLPANTNLSKNVEESGPGFSDITNENSDVAHEPSNECNVNDHTGQMNPTNPFASMIAAAAAARNRQFGAMEESYEIEAETFSDECDTD
jgi:hypothetical protein